VSLVIPAWNEEGRLGQTLERYCPSFKKWGTNFEIIVVTDGSTDRTVEIAGRYSSQGVRVISCSDRLGKGGAIIRGLEVARFDWSGFVDADGPVPPEDVLMLLNYLSEYDCAIASRFLNPNEISEGRTFARSILSRLWNLIVSSILFLDIRDTQCGVKLFRTSAVRQVLPSVALTNWAFDASLLFHLKQAGCRILEVPVKWTESSGSKLNIPRDGSLMLISLLGIRAMNIRAWRIRWSHSGPADHAEGESPEPLSTP